MGDITRKERTNTMAEITRKEQTNVVTDITECATVTNNSMERSAVIYIIEEQYRTCKCNYKHYRTTVMTYITALKRKWRPFRGNCTSRTA